MNFTEHYQLKQPTQEDFYNVGDFNENAATIDRALRDLQTGGMGAKRLMCVLTASAVFRPADHGLQDACADIYLVGGGAGGSTNRDHGGGGGGYCVLREDFRLSAAEYTVVIGEGGAAHAGGGMTQAFSLAAEGGAAPQTIMDGLQYPENEFVGGHGGSGGGGGDIGGFLPTWPSGVRGGDGGTGGGDGGSYGGRGCRNQTTVLAGANTRFAPNNPYDGISYGSGGGGGEAGRGGGAGGWGWLELIEGREIGRDGGIGGGGGSGGGNGGIGGGGGGSGGGVGGQGLVLIYAVPPVNAAGAMPAGGETNEQNKSALLPLLDRALEEKETTISVAILRDGICVDAAVFSDMSTAEQFLADGVWSEADAVCRLPDGFGIGDVYDGENWISKKMPVQECEPREKRYVRELQKLLEVMAEDDEA